MHVSVQIFKAEIIQIAGFCGFDAANYWRWMPTFRRRMFSVIRVEELGVSLTLQRKGFTTFVWNVDIHIANCILIVLREMCANESVVVATS